MATLHVRGVPDELYERVRSLARSNDRSLSAQVITLLHEGLRHEEARAKQGEILGEIWRRRFRPPPGVPDSAALLREDRSR
jgi:plasmid stability protein